MKSESEPGLFGPSPTFHHFGLQLQQEGSAPAPVPDPDPDPGSIRGRGLGVKGKNVFFLSFFHVLDDS